MKHVLFLAAALLGVTASQATLAATTPHKAHHHAATCSDKVLCRKIDGLSATVSKDFHALGDTVTAGQAADADYHAKSLAIETDTVTLVKSIETYEAQGAQVQHAIVLNFDDKPITSAEDPTATASKLCTDAGFKGGKPVEISAKHHFLGSDENLLKSVVCTY